MSGICSNCIEDEFLKRQVASSGKRGKCSVCGNGKRKTFSTSDLAEVLAPIIQHNYQPGGSIPSMGRGDDDHVYYVQEGESLESVIQEVLGQSIDFVNEVVHALVDLDRADIADGEEPFFESDQLYVEIEIAYSSEWDERWECLLESLKHGQRFFNAHANTFFAELFKNIQQWKMWSADAAEPGGVVHRFPAGTRLFRARLCDSNHVAASINEKPADEIGPPPRSKARAGRMNANGVVVFYGAIEKETCIAELRPYIAGRAARITFQTTREIRVLDFTRFGSSGHPSSYFDVNFDFEFGRREFLRKLGHLISQPVVPEFEADYIITQSMAEYLAFVHEQRLDGVMYGSAQNKGGHAIALFRRPNLEDGPDAEPFPVKFVPESLQFVKISGMKFESYPVALHIREGEVFGDFPTFEGLEDTLDVEDDSDIIGR